MSWKEVSEEMEKIEKIVGQMEEQTDRETEKETKEKRKRKERTEVAQVHKEDTSKGFESKQFFCKKIYDKSFTHLLAQFISHQTKLMKNSLHLQSLFIFNNLI